MGIEETTTEPQTEEAVEPQTEEVVEPKAKAKAKAKTEELVPVFLHSKDVTFDMVNGKRMHTGSINGVKFAVECDTTCSVSPVVAEFLANQKVPCS